VSRNAHKDEALLARAAAGDRDAAARCVEKLGPRVADLVQRFGFEGEEAERAVRAIFRRLWSGAARFTADVDEELFAVQAARRWLLDRRARARLEGGGAEVPLSAAEAPPAEQTDLFGVAARVLQALRDLDPEARGTLELVVGRGLPYARIARMRDVPVTQVREAARRGLLYVGERLHGGAS
jgi:RNA polymerase sigma factor (sigma-70 family)